MAWLAAAEQLRAAFMPLHGAGIGPWLLAFAAGLLGTVLALYRPVRTRAAGRPAENLAFQMSFEDAQQRRSA